MSDDDEPLPPPQDELSVTVKRAAGASLGLTLSGDLCVIRQVDGSPGQSAGIPVGAYVTAVAGKAVETVEDVCEKLKDAGEEFEVKFLPPYADGEESPGGSFSDKPGGSFSKAQKRCIVVRINGAVGLAAKNAFCEVKLRSVRMGKVQSSHCNPQKKTTKQVKGESPRWNEAFKFSVRGGDCLRVSVFNKGMLGKDYLGKVDVMMADVFANLEPGGPAVPVTAELTASEDKKVSKVQGALDIHIGIPPEKQL